MGTRAKEGSPKLWNGSYWRENPVKAHLAGVEEYGGLAMGREGEPQFYDSLVSLLCYAWRSIKFSQ